MQEPGENRLERAISAVFKALWGTDALMASEEERRKAVDAIERMGAEAMRVKEVVNCEPKPTITIDDALKAMSKDLRGNQEK